MPAGLKLRSAKVVGVRFVCCDVVARSCGLATLLRSRDIVCGVAELRSCGVAELRSCGVATLLRSRGVATFVGCGVAESRRWVVAESRRCGAAVVSRRCSVVAVWSQCGRSVVVVWSRCGAVAVVAELRSRGVVESRSCRSLKLQTV